MVEPAISFRLITPATETPMPLSPAPTATPPLAITEAMEWVEEASTTMPLFSSTTRPFCNLLTPYFLLSPSPSVKDPLDQVFLLTAPSIRYFSSSVLSFSLPAVLILLLSLPAAATVLSLIRAAVLPLILLLDPVTPIAAETPWPPAATSSTPA